jgi:hypothetical protein
VAVCGGAALLAVAPAGFARAGPQADLWSAAAISELSTRDCLTSEGSRRASKFECEVEIAPKALKLSIAYGADGWSGGGASSWEDLHEQSFSESGFRFLEGAGPLLSSQQDVDARMGFKGNAGGLSYRAEYRVSHDVADGFSSRLPSKKVGGLLETSWSLGPIQPKLELSHSQEQQVHSNAEEKSLSKMNFSVDLRLPDLPVLTLNLGRESSEVVSTAPWGRLTAVDSEQLVTDVASVSLWYGRERWEAYFTSSFFQIERVLDDRSDTVMHDHVFSLSYRPTDAISIVPLFEYTKSEYKGRDYEATTMLGSLGLHHSSFGGTLNSYVYASYLADRDSQGYVDARSIDLSLGVEKDVGRYLGLSYGKQTIGLEFNVGRYQDLLYREASTSTYGAFLRIRIRP